MEEKNNITDTENIVSYVSSYIINNGTQCPHYGDCQLDKKDCCNFTVKYSSDFGKVVEWGYVAKGCYREHEEIKLNQVFNE